MKVTKTYLFVEPVWGWAKPHQDVSLNLGLGREGLVLSWGLPDYKHKWYECVTLPLLSGTYLQCKRGVRYIFLGQVWLSHLGLSRKTMMKSGEFLCRFHVNVLYQLHIYRSISSVFYEFIDSVSWLPELSSKVMKEYIWKSHWNWAGSWGAPGHKAFLCPLFFHYRKWTSFNLHDLPWVPVGRFKYLLIRKGMGCWWETVKKHIKKCVALEQGPGHTHIPPWGIRNNIFEQFCSY